MTEDTLDWDRVDYVKFDRETRASFRRNIESFVPARMGRIAFWFRRSSGGRVHVKSVSSRRMDPAERLALRILLDDDPVRLRMDAARFLRGESTNRLWSSKVSKGKKGRVGPWRFWFRLN